MHQTSTIVPTSTGPLAHRRRPASWSERAGAYLPALRRLIVIAAIAWWLGGFTFYSGVAIPMGVQVLGTHRAVGFITEHVTNWLNVGGVIALGILLWNLLLGWHDRGKALRYTLLITWIAMAAIEIELISVHPAMDRLITTHPVRMILDEDRFDLLHHVYLISTSVQWAIGVIHVWCICAAWTQSQPRYFGELSRAAAVPHGVSEEQVHS